MATYMQKIIIGRYNMENYKEFIKEIFNNEKVYNYDITKKL